jgi:FkbM family methyltransferase
MMLDFTSLISKYNIKIKGIIQLGAHYFQEREVFTNLGVKDFVLVEPQTHAFQILKHKCNGLNAALFKYAVSDEEGIFEMKCDRSNEGQSSSLLEAKEHLRIYPGIEFTRTEKVRVKRLENLYFDRQKYNVLVMDLQGNELKAIKGAGNLLETIDAIYTEVNFIEMYKGCVLIDDLDTYLFSKGFTRVETGENYNKQGWSDAFYIRYEKIK